jgi:hypothetical protein
MMSDSRYARWLCVLPALFAATPVLADTPPVEASSLSSSLGVYVFPAKGQTTSQQQGDEAACFAWAKAQTGFDPIATSQAASPTAQPSAEGGGARKVVGGAVAGAAIGAVAGDTGKGAAIGATAGVLKAGHDRRKSRREQKQAQAEADKAQAELAEQKGNYNKAFGACLEGKGYTVK